MIGGGGLKKTKTYSKVYQKKVVVFLINVKMLYDIINR